MSWIKKYQPRVSLYHLWLIFLGLSIFVSAIVVISVSHQSRALFSKYHSLQLVERNQYDERARLLLQEGSESSLRNLEIKAKRELGMLSPSLNDRLFIK